MLEVFINSKKKFFNCFIEKDNFYTSVIYVPSFRKYIKVYKYKLREQEQFKQKKLTFWQKIILIIKNIFNKLCCKKIKL